MTDPRVGVLVVAARVRLRFVGVLVNVTRGGGDDDGPGADADGGGGAGRGCCALPLWLEEIDAVRKTPEETRIKFTFGGGGPLLRSRSPTTESTAGGEMEGEATGGEETRGPEKTVLER